MQITIGRKSTSFFQNPLSLLNECHRRIERFLYLLITVTRYAQGGELNLEQRNAWESSLRYFSSFAPKHTLDEEESLFPRMRATRNPEAKAVLEKIDALEKEHDVAQAYHKQMEALGRRWLNDGRLSDQDTYRLTELLSNLSSLYHKHIHLEETEVFPLAGRILNPREIEAIKREMAARRDIILEPQMITSG